MFKPHFAALSAGLCAGALFLASLTGPLPSAHAETILLPESRHQQFQTYGLFMDQQSMLVFRFGRRAWGSLGGALALYEKPDWKYKPQLVVHGSATAAFRFNEKFDTLLTETVDARVGLAVDLTLSEAWLLSLGWTHMSGHISDDVLDRDLIGSNLGNESLWARAIRIVNPKLRIGGTLKPVVGSEPKMKFFAADQFIEYFPWGVSENFQDWNPFVAGSLEEYGPDKVDLTYHLQLGWFAGNHTFAKKHSSIRTVAGYYHGIDPRLKYAQFKYRRTDFFYAGLMFDI